MLPTNTAMKRRHTSFLFLAMFLASAFTARASVGQELHISATGEVRLLNAAVVTKHALNLYSVNVWGQTWTIPIDQYVKVESAGGLPIQLEEILVGHLLEVQGKPTYNKTGWIDAALVKDLSIRTGTIPPPAPPTTRATGPPPPAKNVPPPAAPPVAHGGVITKLTQELAQGMSGGEVTTLQEFLQKHNWGIPDNGPVTGYFGTVTKKAVMNFQSSQGLAATGIVGLEARTLINALLGGAPAPPPPSPQELPLPAPPPPPSRQPTAGLITHDLEPGMRGNEILILQEFLHTYGWGIPDAGSVTGYYGNITKQAVANFQAANGIPATGIVGPRTRELLNEILGQ